MKPPAVTRQQIQIACEQWGEFWDAPKKLTSGSGNVYRWQDCFLAGINRSITARKHWEQARMQVFATCRWFPLPVDVIEAAKQIQREEDVVQEQKDGNPRKRQQTPEMEAAVHSLVSETLEKMREGE